MSDAFAREPSDKLDKIINFKEFEKPDYEQWKEAAVKMLKGASFEKKLFSQTYEGITLRPIYDQKDLTNIPYVDSLPGEAPFLRGTSLLGTKTHAKNENSWLVSQSYGYPTGKENNEALASDYKRGLGGIVLLLDTPTKNGEDPDGYCKDKVGQHGLSATFIDDIDQVFEGIDLSDKGLIVDCGSGALPFAALYFASKNQVSDNSKICCIGMDPLGDLARNSFINMSIDHAWTEMTALTRWALKNSAHVKTILVNTAPYADAACSIVEELGFAIATGVEYLRVAINNDIDIDDAAKSILFCFSVGTDFFGEIAKFRAVRMLWNRVMESFGASEENRKIVIHAKTATWNQTILDPHMNMLRSTTETFCAAISGADSIQSNPFDEAIGLPNEFSRRIARNMQMVLHEEGNLGKVTDPAGGSWFVENLTDEIAKKSWNLFQQIEEQGGMTKALLSGFVKDTIDKTRQLKHKDLSTRKSIMIGSNMYPNIDEEKIVFNKPEIEEINDQRKNEIKKIRLNRNDKVYLKELANLENDFKTDGHNTIKDTAIDLSISAAKAGATIGEIAKIIRKNKTYFAQIKPLKIERGAKMFEDLREMATDIRNRTGKSPQVFIANMGSLAQYKPRADFARGFFEVGGFKVIDNKGFDTTQMAVDAAIASESLIVVICSTDKTYPQIVPSFTKQLKAANKNISIVLAGFPKDKIEDYKNNGVDEFIHLKANIYKILKGFLEKSVLEKNFLEKKED